MISQVSLTRAALRLAPAVFLTAVGALGFAPSQARAQATGAVTVLHNFTGTDGSAPITGPIKAIDGNYYGAIYTGGATNQGAIYKLTPDGTYSVLHSFVQDFLGGGALEGDSPKVLIQGLDGNLYGICRGGGKGPTTPDGGGTFFRLGLDGTYTKLYDFDTGKTGAALFPSALVQGSDGNFYGLTRDGGVSNAGEGTYFRITPAGVLTVLFEFKGGNGPGYRPEAQLIVGADGNFYGLTTTGGSSGGNSGNGTIFMATQAGAVTQLYVFLGGSNAPGGGVVELTQGTDGKFYGVSPSGGQHSRGAIYSYGLDGTFTLLHDYDDPRTDGAIPGPLTQGDDGNFYGSTTNGFPVKPNSITDDGNGSYFQLTPTGNYTILAKTQGLNNGPTLPNGKLLNLGGGSFLGVTQGGGPAGFGTITNLVVTGSTAPFSFFNGQAALDNGAYYLAFANGNPFGYYSFLTDQHYIYHFDLGFEYIFDAADGKKGVYLYDFTSNTFFYTSPTFPFPYLYDFTLNSVVYYYPDPNNPGRYNTNGVRYFYVFKTGKIISK